MHNVLKLHKNKDTEKNPERSQSQEIPTSIGAKRELTPGSSSEKMQARRK